MKMSTRHEMQQYQDEMVELRVTQLRQRWTIWALLCGCCLLSATTAAFGVRLMMQPEPPACVALPHVQRDLNPENPQKLIDEANARAGRKSKKKAVPVKNDGKKIHTTLT